jgi:peptidyl-prolyl cis-trans isomerase B (cyclophilin B)
MSETEGAKSAAPVVVKNAAFAVLLAAVAMGLVLFLSTASRPSASEYASKRVRIKTRLGDMVVRFFPDVAPRTVKNFCDLAQKGFYNGIIFHRVIRGFMIQGGDPKGTGEGGPGYTIKAEFNRRPHVRGTLSMARASDPDSAGSQFFIVHGEHAASLDGQYTVFGELASGLEVLDRIAEAPVNGERPLDPVKMDSVTVEDAR